MNVLLTTRQLAIIERGNREIVFFKVFYNLPRSVGSPTVFVAIPARRTYLDLVTRYVTTVNMLFVLEHIAAGETPMSLFIVGHSQYLQGE